MMIWTEICENVSSSKDYFQFIPSSMRKKFPAVGGAVKAGQHGAMERR
jgi:hypothetical protein